MSRLALGRFKHDPEIQDVSAFLEAPRRRLIMFVVARRDTFRVTVRQREDTGRANARHEEARHENEG